MALIYSRFLRNKDILHHSTHSGLSCRSVAEEEYTVLLLVLMKQESANDCFKYLWVAFGKTNLQVTFFQVFPLDLLLFSKIFQGFHKFYFSLGHVFSYLGEIFINCLQRLIMLEKHLLLLQVPLTKRIAKVGWFQLIFQQEFCILLNESCKYNGNRLLSGFFGGLEAVPMCAPRVQTILSSFIKR